MVRGAPAAAVAEKLKPRATYRAVYLSAPLKYHTTLHAFTRKAPLFHIDAWKKDHHAWEKHKWRAAKDRERGRWNYNAGPMSGVRTEGWPDPGLLGAEALVSVAARAQGEKLQDFAFWQQVAERSYALRDVLPVGSVAVILDALVSADHRHTQLMKTMAREIIDDVDKMPLVEVAVVANAYAHFRCVSKPLLDALAQQAVLLLSDKAPPYVQAGGDLASDPGSLSVLTRSFATLEHPHAELLQACAAAAVANVDYLSFPVIVDLLSSCVKMRVPFKADANFWATLATKAPTGRMASLCPALEASGKLGASDPKLREALVSAVSAGLREAPDDVLPKPFGSALGLWGSAKSGRARLPAFAAPGVPDELLARTLGLEVSAPASPIVEEEASLLEFPPQTPSIFDAPGDEILEQEQADAAAAAPRRRPPWWYNTVGRHRTLPVMPGYHGFDASANFDRNRRGFLVGSALEGLNAHWHGATGVLEARPADAELELLSAAAPVLQASLPGLTASQLVACAELYAARARLPSRPAASAPKADAKAAAGSAASPGPADRPPAAKAGATGADAAAPGKASIDAGAEAAAASAKPALGGAAREVRCEVVRDIVQEAVRKLSQFTPSELKRLRAASKSTGLDPYLEQARRRRFPKALRKELRDEEANTASA